MSWKILLFEYVMYASVNYKHRVSINKTNTHIIENLDLWNSGRALKRFKVFR